MLDSHSSASCTSCCVSEYFSLRMRYLICGNMVGATLSSLIPSPISRVTAAGSPAISPQTPVQIRCLLPASTVICIRRSRAGWVGSYRSATFSFSRSTASVYWIRSLVPILKNLARVPNTSAVSAAEGISIMMPTSRFSSNSVFSARSSLWHSSSSALASSSSSTPEIIGYITLRFPLTLARSRALSWVRKISLRARQNRMARQPRKGLASSVSPIAWLILSAPISRVRKITGSGARAWATRL